MCVKHFFLKIAVKGRTGKKAITCVMKKKKKRKEQIILKFGKSIRRTKDKFK